MRSSELVGCLEVVAGFTNNVAVAMKHIGYVFLISVICGTGRLYKTFGVQKLLCMCYRGMVLFVTSVHIFGEAIATSKAVGQMT